MRRPKPGQFNALNAGLKASRRLSIAFFLCISLLLPAPSTVFAKDKSTESQKETESQDKNLDSKKKSAESKEKNSDFKEEKSKEEKEEKDLKDKNSDQKEKKKSDTKDKKPEPNMAVRVYHKVWEMVKEKFYEPTYGGQDWSRWEHKYDKWLKDEEDEQRAIDTMLASLGDRYTRYLNKAAFDDETTSIKGQIGGIGVQIAYDPKTGKLIVLAAIEGTPAGKAGLQSGDEIELIDGAPTKGLSLQQASSKLRGVVDTNVTLKIMRKNEAKEYTLTRAEIVLRSVQTVKMLNSDIGYIRLSTFLSSRAGQEVQDALVELTPARGIILDLRQNPGGLVSNAIDICSLLLFNKAGALGNPVVVSTVDRNNHSVDTRATGKFISNQPFVVLIDEGTASAAEITSGALKDTGRAQLIGAKRSFGKGLVQSVTRLEDDSGLNCTIARYVTPNRVDINKKGIVPDYIVELEDDDRRQGRGPWWLYNGPNGGMPDPVGSKDIQLKKALEVIEAKLKSEAPYAVKLQLDKKPVVPFEVKPEPEESPYKLKLEVPFSGR